MNTTNDNEDNTMTGSNRVPLDVADASPSPDDPNEEDGLMVTSDDQQHQEHRRPYGPAWAYWLLASGVFYLLLLLPSLGMAMMGAMMFDDPNLHGFELLMVQLIYLVLLAFPVVLIGSLVAMCRNYGAGNLQRAVRASFLPLIGVGVIVALFVFLALVSNLVPS